MKPVQPLAVTLGDPAGIGPEVAAKVIAARTPESRPLVLVGSRWALERGAIAAGITLPEVVGVGSPGEVDSGLGLIDLGQQPQTFKFGVVDRRCGALAVQAVEHAARLCMTGEVAGMVTCPINKAAIHAAGFVDDIGHQEILSRLTRSEATATMLMTPGLRVVHLSTHKSLLEAARFVTCANVLASLRLMDSTLKHWGLANVRIAVAALNPHGGENGLLSAPI